VKIAFATVENLFRELKERAGDEAEARVVAMETIRNSSGIQRSEFYVIVTAQFDRDTVAEARVITGDVVMNHEREKVVQRSKAVLEDVKKAAAQYGVRLRFGSILEPEGPFVARVWGEATGFNG